MFDLKGMFPFFEGNAKEEEEKQKKEEDDGHSNISSLTDDDDSYREREAQGTSRNNTNVAHSPSGGETEEGGWMHQPASSVSPALSPASKLSLQELVQIVVEMKKVREGGSPLISFAANNDYNLHLPLVWHLNRLCTYRPPKVSFFSLLST